MVSFCSLTWRQQRTVIIRSISECKNSITPNAGLVIMKWDVILWLQKTMTNKGTLSFMLGVGAFHPEAFAHHTGMGWDKPYPWFPKRLPGSLGIHQSFKSIISLLIILTKGKKNCSNICLRKELKAFKIQMCQYQVSLKKTILFLEYFTLMDKSLVT